MVKQRQMDRRTKRRQLPQKDLLVLQGSRIASARAVNVTCMRSTVLKFVEQSRT